MDAVDYCVEITDGRGRRLSGEWVTAESVEAMEAVVAEAFSAFSTLRASAPGFADFSMTCRVRPAEGSTWTPPGVIVAS